MADQQLQPDQEPVKKTGKKDAPKNDVPVNKFLDFISDPEIIGKLGATIAKVVSDVNDFQRLDQEKKWEEMRVSDADREMIPLTPEEKKRRVEDSFKRDRRILVRECYIALLHRNTMIEPADVQQAAEKHADHLMNVFRADFDELDAMRNDDLLPPVVLPVMPEM